MSYENFRTLLAEISAILNTRPLTYLQGDDPALPTLCPLDLFSRTNKPGFPTLEEDWEAGSVYMNQPTTHDLIADEVRKTTKVIDRFWQMWRDEYLPALREHHRRLHKSRQQANPGEPHEGETVYLYQEDVPRGHWKLARVEQLNRGLDGLIRSAVVKAPTGKDGQCKLFKRLINHLYSLEISGESTNDYEESSAPAEQEERVEEAIEVDDEAAILTTDIELESLYTRSEAGLSPNATSWPFFIMLLSLTASTARCEEHFRCPNNAVHAEMIQAPKCLEDGYMVWTYQGEYCWSPVHCPGSKIVKQPHPSAEEFYGQDNWRLRLNEEQCECDCPEWAESCSFYTGPQRIYSTVENSTTTTLINRLAPYVCSFEPSPDCSTEAKTAHFHLVQLFDDTRHLLQHLNLDHNEVIPTEHECVEKAGYSVSEGTIGTPPFCQIFECSDQAAGRFCSFPHGGVTYLVGTDTDGTTLKTPIKAWGSITRSFYPPVMEPTDIGTSLIECVNDGLRVQTPRKAHHVEVCAQEECIKRGGSFRYGEVFKLAAKTRLSNYTATTIIFGKDGTITKRNVTCPAVDVCLTFDCFACTSMMANPQCAHTYVLIALFLALYIGGSWLVCVWKGVTNAVATLNFIWRTATRLYRLLHRLKNALLHVGNHGWRRMQRLGEELDGETATVHYHPKLPTPNNILPETSRGPRLSIDISEELADSSKFRSSMTEISLSSPTRLVSAALPIVVLILLLPSASAAPIKASSTDPAGFIDYNCTGEVVAVGLLLGLVVALRVLMAMTWSDGQSVISSSSSNDSNMDSESHHTDPSDQYIDMLLDHWAEVNDSPGSSPPSYESTDAWRCETCGRWHTEADYNDGNRQIEAEQGPPNSESLYLTAESGMPEETHPTSEPMDEYSYMDELLEAQAAEEAELVAESMATRAVIRRQMRIMELHPELYIDNVIERRLGESSYLGEAASRVFDIITNDQRPFPQRSRTTSGATNRLASTTALSRSLPLLLLFATATVPISAYDETILLSARQEECQQKGGSTVCSFSNSTTFTSTVVGDSIEFFFQRDQTGQPMGSLVIQVNERVANCEKSIIGLSRSANLHHTSVKRCAGAGSCTGENCANQASTEIVSELRGAATDFPGHSSCYASCGCWGCGCLLCQEGCLFVWTYASPTPDTAVYEIFKCNAWPLQLNLKVTKQIHGQTPITYEVALPNGETVVVEPGLKLGWPTQSLPPLPLLSTHFISNGKKTAVLDEFHNRPHKFSCPSPEAAESFNCSFPQSTCHCHEADERAVCTCDYQSIENYIEDDRLLPVTNPVATFYDKPTVHATIDSQPNVQLQIETNLQLIHVDSTATCDISILHLKGSRNGYKGVEVGYKCQSTEGQVRGHIRCQSTSFAVSCTPKPTTATVRLSLTEPVYNETCVVKCPGGTKEFHFHGKLGWASDSPPSGDGSNAAGWTTLTTTRAAQSLYLWFKEQWWHLVAAIGVRALAWIFPIGPLIGGLLSFIALMCNCCRRPQLKTHSY